MFELALLLSALMGGVLGLVGGGGSLLAVPILVYVAGVAPLEATGGGLVIVGLSAFWGTLTCLRRGLLRIKPLLLFALASVCAVALARGVLLPLIPDPVLHSPVFTLSLGKALMLMFALLLITAAWRLWQPQQISEAQASVPRVLLAGAGTGALTGLIGAGGGFLIVPALMLGARLPLANAVAGSLAVISVNCAIGVFISQHTGHLPAFSVLLPVTLAALLGMSIGLYFAPRVPARRLQRGFAVLMLLIALAILVQEVWPLVR